MTKKEKTQLTVLRVLGLRFTESQGAYLLEILWSRELAEDWPQKGGSADELLSSFGGVNIENGILTSHPCHDWSKQKATHSPPLPLLGEEARATLRTYAILLWIATRDIADVNELQIHLDRARANNKPTFPFGSDEIRVTSMMAGLRKAGNGTSFCDTRTDEKNWALSVKPKSRKLDPNIIENNNGKSGLYSLRNGIGVNDEDADNLLERLCLPARHKNISRVHRIVEDSNAFPENLFPDTSNKASPVGEIQVTTTTPSSLVLPDSGHIPSTQDFPVPDMKEGYYFLNPPLKLNEIKCNLEESAAPFHPELEPIRKQRIEAQEIAAKKNNKMLDNNKSYSLHGVRVRRPQKSNSERENHIVCTLRPTDYFHFIFPNNVLDEVIEIGGNKTTARSFLKLDKNHVDINNLPEGAHYKIGTNTVLVTNDNKVILSIRSGRTFTLESATFHVSTAEGMLGGRDVIDGRPSPFETAARSLKDELGLECEKDFSINDLLCLGLFLDTQRMQPLFVFFLKSSHLSGQNVIDCRPMAKDGFENSKIVAINWSFSTVLSCIEKGLVYESTNIRIASNHAHLALHLALRYDFKR